MIGLVVPGQLPCTNFRQVGPTKWATQVSPPLPSNRLLVFLTGQSPLPPDHGAAVYITFSGSTSFEYLGWLTNEKPSELFTIPTPLLTHPPKPLEVGVSLESFADLKNVEQVNEDNSTRNLNRRAAMVQRVGHDLFNFMQSFAHTDPAHPGYTIVPTNSFEQWMKKTDDKLKKDPNYLND